MNTITLSNGVHMPCMVMSTNWMDYPVMKEVVTAGLKLGFRAFDTARDYGNEHIVGRVIEECLKEQGLKREDIFITTKIGNSQQILGNIDKQIEISLNNLRSNYVDLWLMHWPYPDYFVENWHKMEKVYKTEKVKAIGIANCRLRHFKTLEESGFEITPHCVQHECHPLRTTDDLIEYCNSKKIAIQAYSPLCRMIPEIKNASVLVNLAKKYNKTEGQIILRWHIQRGTVPVFKSVKKNRLAENISIFDFKLTDEEVLQISALNQNYKYHLESASCPGF